MICPLVQGHARARADIHDGQEHKRSVKGRIQKRKTYHLQIITFGLQRAAGPYRWANNVVIQSIFFVNDLATARTVLMNSSARVWAAISP
jgi:hypothetical protein